jgi:hypothetical protein
MAETSLADHQTVKELLYDLDKIGPEGNLFNQKFQKLIDDLHEHNGKEETEVIPLMISKMSKDDLEHLYNAINYMKPLCPTRPHPSAPDKPPANMLAGLFIAMLFANVAGPVAAFLDRIRDLGRSFATSQ